MAGLDELKFLFPKDKPMVTTIRGTVESVAADTLNIIADGSTEPIEAIKGCSAVAGDRVLCINSELGSLVSIAVIAGSPHCPFPVGSIHMSISPVNPSTLWEGTTWAAWGTGRVPVGIDTSQTEFNTVQKTGGEKTHTLTETQMPSHNHKLGWFGVFNGGTGTGHPNTWEGDSPNFKTTTNTGGGAPHNNLQPYITCYMWLRTE